MRRVSLPADSVRGGVMTQAIVLKVTANGTTTSPVVRGKWISERILGQIVPPPPSGVPAVDPDTRGAVTIRQQLDKHRADQSCAACHNKIDPQGFALENFDVMGGWRDRYRGDAKDKIPELGLGKNGWPFDFHYALPVESQGQLPDGRKFNDVREFKQLILQDEAANCAQSHAAPGGLRHGCADPVQRSRGRSSRSSNKPKPTNTASAASCTPSWKATSS